MRTRIYADILALVEEQAASPRIAGESRSSAMVRRYVGFKSFRGAR